MRTYEALAAKRYDKVVLDRLTMDTFHASRKTNLKDKQSAVVAREMFYTTFWANLICIMADYSVHQVLLCYGYYAYYQSRRKMQDQQQTMQADKNALMHSFAHKSLQLFTARSLGLLCSAVGGAFGSLVWPGWGTLLFSNCGEGAAGVIIEEAQAPKKDTIAD